MYTSATGIESIADTEIMVDVLIIGTEAAGAKAAIEAHLQGAKVLAVSKGAMGRSGATVMAGAGVQAPIAQANPLDSPDCFFSDVIKGGAYLNNQKLVERLVNMANTEVLKMEEWGARFIKTKDGKFVQGQAPGSSFPRTLWTIGQYGGRQWRKALKSEFKWQDIVPLEDFFVTSLLMTDGQVAGATGVSLSTGSFYVLRSKITIVATGGADQIYLHTDTPCGATGDGIVLAYNAGAELQDMEFHQFFPYHCYGPPGREHFVVPGLRYGLRGRLYNSQGEEFLNNYAPMSKGWALRDPTSRAIYLENKAGRGSPSGGAYLSVSHLPLNLVETTLASLAPRLSSKVKKAGIDLSREAFEVGPASHYTIGGIRVNEDCDTSVPRLMAVGENAAGMDGAERIDAGPAITWCLTMGRIAGLTAAVRSKELSWLPVDAEQVASARKKVEALYSRGKGVRGWEVKKRLKNLMWEECGLVRHQSGMEEALKRVREMKEKWIPELYVPGESRCFNVGLIDALEAENMLLISELTILSALMRRESRRSHCRTDYPVANNREWLKNIIVRKSGQEDLFSTEAPIMHRMAPPVDESGEESHGPRR